jgi:hypothetical protein
MEYKVNFKNQFSVTDGLIRLTVLVIIVPLIIGFTSGFTKGLILIFGIFYLVNLLVVILIHFYFLYKSKNITILKNPFIEKIIFDIDGKSRIISLDGKEKIEVHLPPSLFRGDKISWFPFEDYHYAIIITKEANYVITCLVMPKIMEEFDKLGIKYTKKWRFFPYIRKEYY